MCRQNCWKSSLEKCIFGKTALFFVCQFNKNTLFKCAFSAILPAGLQEPSIHYATKIIMLFPLLVLVRKTIGILRWWQLQKTAFYVILYIMTFLMFLFGHIEIIWEIILLNLQFLLHNVLRRRRRRRRSRKPPSYASTIFFFRISHLHVTFPHFTTPTSFPGLLKFKLIKHFYASLCPLRIYYVMQ